MSGESVAKPVLLVLAAGTGSRYGGLKQIDPVGPNGETIIDYSIYDAVRAGFGAVVFVIRRSIEASFKEVIGARFESRINVEYAFQELDRLPQGFSPPPLRTKPWGTGHAVLAASEAIRQPFGVINADDFYGQTSFQLLARFLQSGTGDNGMVGFTLRNTLSNFGAVARGVCTVTPEDFLQEVTEMTGLERVGQAARNTDPNGKVQMLTGSEIASLNMWGFTPHIFKQLEGEMSTFLHMHPQDPKVEFYLTTAVNNLIAAGLARVKVLKSPDSWAGVTFREDQPRVRQTIQELIRAGRYPEKLR
jgi:dTDP-glucose pyrophosphorylase